MNLHVSLSLPLKLTLALEQLDTGAVAASTSPWIKYAGMFENDPDFATIAATIRADLDRKDNTAVDASVYAIEA